jgi:hypothetical protein
MSLVSRDFVASPGTAEEMSDETSGRDSLPPLLDEVVAQSARGAHARKRAARCRPSRARIRAVATRRERLDSSNRTPFPGEVVVGRLVGISEAGEPQVTHPFDPSNRPLAARSTVPLDRSQVGREVVIAFDRRDFLKPIVIGILRQPGEKLSVAPAPVHAPSRPPFEAERDGEQLVFTARKEIVLRCGQASIALTRAGKVLIRGAYLLSRSSGVNRIKGGSIQLN